MRILPNRTLDPGDPRGSWTLWRWMDVQGPDGSLYLRRLYVFRGPKGGIYLHHIVREDWERAMHSHPFKFRSIILNGGYVECVADMDHERLVLKNERIVRRRRFRSHRFPDDGVHVITHVKPRTWTLVLVGKRHRDWGFWQDGVGIVKWDEYLRSIGHPQAR